MVADASIICQPAPPRTYHRGRLRTNIHPRRIRLEASTHCQLRCPSCPTTAGLIDEALGKGFLGFEDFRTLVDHNRRVREIELSNYGELLLNPQLVPMLEYAQQKRVVISMDSVNLNHATPAALDAIVRTGVRFLSVSIDGASQETYAKYRLRGDFGRVIANVREINRLKQTYESSHPELRWQFIVFGHNEHEISAAREMAESLGMSFFLKLSWDEEFSPIVDREHVAREMESTAVTRGEVKATTGSDYGAHICSQLWLNPQINWNGDILGCCRNFWGTFGGNAFRDGLADAINGEEMQYARAMLAGQAPPRDGVPCTTCDIYRDRAEKREWVELPPEAGPVLRARRWLARVRGRA